MKARLSFDEDGSLDAKLKVCWCCGQEVNAEEMDDYGGVCEFCWHTTELVQE